MKTPNRIHTVLLGATLLVGLMVGLCQAADSGASNNTPLMQKQTRITQAQRQAAADRAKAKGFIAPKIDTAVTPDTTPQAKGGS